LNIATRAWALGAALGILSLAAGCSPKAPAVQDTHSPTHTPSARRRSLSLLTYNVLADPADADIRIDSLLRTIEEAEADIIALQEAAPWFVERLRREPWAGDYHVTLGEGERRASGGLVIMSRLPIIEKTYVPLAGRQRRGFLLARVRIGDRALAVGTVHLESFLEDGPIRARQLETVFALLRRHPDAILMGDFNFGDDDESETSRLEAGYADLWLSLRPDEPGFTWDIDRSGMARRGSFPGEPSRRLDRILLKSALWEPAQIHIIGDRPVAEGATVFPSDHFGLTGRIKVGTAGPSR